MKNQNDTVSSRRGNPLMPQGAADNMFPDPHIKIFVNPDTGKENMYVYAGHEGEGIHSSCGIGMCVANAWLMSGVA